MLNIEPTCVLDFQNIIKPASKTIKSITSGLTTFISGQTQKNFSDLDLMYLRTF